MSLVSKAARDKQVPMPFLSILLDRFTSAKAKGRAEFDWSAIGISVAEDAGLCAVPPDNFLLFIC